MGRVVGVDDVVAVDPGAGRDPPNANVVVPRGDEAGGAGAVGIAGIEHGCAAVAVVAVRNHVGRQVRVPGVKAVVDQGHSGALPQVAGRPHLPDVDVLARRPAQLPRVLQVPLAPGEGVAQGVVQGRGERRAPVEEFAVDVVLVHAQRVPPCRRAGTAGPTRDLEVVRPRAEAVAEQEPGGSARGPPGLGDVRVNGVPVRVQQLPGDGDGGARPAEDDMGRSGELDAEVVDVVRRADGPRLGEQRDEGLRRRGAAARLGGPVHVERVGAGYVAGAPNLHVVGPRAQVRTHEEAEVGGAPQGECLHVRSQHAPALPEVAPRVCGAGRVHQQNGVPSHRDAEPVLVGPLRIDDPPGEAADLDDLGIGPAPWSRRRSSCPGRRRPWRRLRPRP